VGSGFLSQHDQLSVAGNDEVVGCDLNLKATLATVYQNPIVIQSALV